MKQIFPVEILELSTHNHFVKFSSNTKRIYWVILLMVLGGFSVLPFFTISITQQARGIVRSPQENNIVCSFAYGRITENRICENMNVCSGDTLIMLDTEKICNELDALFKKLKQNKAFEADLEMLLSNDEIKLTTDIYKEEFFERDQKLFEFKTEIKKKEKEFKISKFLLEKDVIARQEFEEKEHAFFRMILDEELFLQQKQLDWQTKLEKVKIDIQDVQLRIDQLKKEKENFVIKAPLSGVVSNFIGLMAGNYVDSGQRIAQISPKGKLIVECVISPSDIGYLFKDMKTTFQFDAFNYNQWGVLHGKVIEISPDVFQANNTNFFKVRCSLDSDNLILSNGYIGRIKKGMSLTARFQVTERTLFQLLYDKVDDWLNPRYKN